MEERKRGKEGGGGRGRRDRGKDKGRRKEGKREGGLTGYLLL